MTQNSVAEIADLKGRLGVQLSNLSMQGGRNGLNSRTYGLSSWQLQFQDLKGDTKWSEPRCGIQGLSLLSSEYSPKLSEYPEKAGSLHCNWEFLSHKLSSPKLQSPPKHMWLPYTKSGHWSICLLFHKQRFYLAVKTKQSIDRRGVNILSGLLFSLAFLMLTPVHLVMEVLHTSGALCTIV